MRHSKVTPYPVDDFGLKGTDNAAVVEHWMFLIQGCKGCGCLGGGQPHGYYRSVNFLQCVRGFVPLCVCSSPNAW